MTPSLALVLCLLFCFWAITKDVKSRPQVSWALWIPTLWLFRCASRSLNYWVAGVGVELIDETSASAVGGSGLADTLFMTVLLLAGLMALPKRRLSVSAVASHNPWLFLFFVYMGCSCVWAPAPFISLKRFIHVAGDLVMVLITMTEAEPIMGFFTVLRRSAIFYIPLSVVVSRYFPQFGRTQSKSWDHADPWVGLSTHKNALTAYLMIAVMYFVWNILRSKREKTPLVRLFGPRWVSLDLVYILLALYLMFNGPSRSSTAILALGVGLMVCMLLGGMHQEKRYFWSRLFKIGAAYAVLQVLCLVFAGESASDFFLEIQGKHADLTGRTEYWPVLIGMGMKNPILGTGYGGFWTPELMNHFLEISVWGFLPESHNGYIETFVNLGFVGLILLLINIGVAVASAWRTLSIDFEYGRVRLMILAAIIVHNFAEAGFPRENHTIFIIFLMMAMYVPPLKVASIAKSVSAGFEDDFAADDDSVPAT